MRLCILVIVAVLAELLDIFAQEQFMQKEKFIYKNQVGFCEPLTIEMVASLVTKEIHRLLEPRLRLQPKKLSFDLYTRRNPYERQILNTGDEKALISSHFNSSWPVRLSIHGWNGRTTTCSNAAIKDAYLERGDFNMILVDWSDYAHDINYIRVVVGIFEISTKLNEFTRFLHEVADVSYAEMYLIGHSAGCHIAGVAGKLLKPDRYGAIYALDTSGVIHMRLNEKWRLTANDAIYVESIQTDIALLGFTSSGVGHASFYPNWGLGQPHCPNVNKMEPYFACDHFGALYYFVESIRNSTAFGSIKCKNFDSILMQKCNCGKARKECPAQVYMGGEPAVHKRGIFYVSTRGEMPFGNGDVCLMKRPLRPTVLRIQLLMLFQSSIHLGKIFSKDLLDYPGTSKI
ncbi:putative phospholipase A1 magnifin [Glossina fuscipes fuscipes]